MNLRLDGFRDLRARFHRDLLDRLALGAEHDLALAIALDKDRLVDADGAVAKLLPRSGFDRG